MTNHTKPHKERLKLAALDYIEKSKTVIPLKGKVPLISGWAEDDYSSDEDDVEEWFTDFGDKMTGIGIRTGFMDDVFVLDLEAEQELSDLDLPQNGVRSKSGRDGMHYYFSDIGEDSFEFTSTSLKKYGIEGDLKGNKGYIVAPPSIHPVTGNEYQWIEPLSSDDLKPAPEWLVKMLEQKKVEKEEWDGVISEPVKEGGRHNTAVRFTGKLLAHIPEKDWDEIVYTSLTSWNDTMCDPPLPSSELHSIYSSLCVSQRKQRKEKDIQTSSFTEKLPMSVNDVLNMPIEEKPSFLVKSLIPEKGITAMAGHPGCGKSWLMMEIARAVSTGTNFLHNESLETKQTNVLIVDEESGIWEMRRRMELLQFEKTVPVHFFSLNSFKLDKEERIKYLLTICKKYDIGLIIFDPFASMHDGVENNADEMQLVMSAMQRFVEEEITVLFIHHHRKGGIGTNGLSLRGSSAILGRLDSLLVIEKNEDENNPVITIKHVKSRRDKPAKSLRVTLCQKDDESPVELLFAGEASEALLKKDKAKLLILEILKYENLYKFQIVDAISEEDDIGVRNIGEALKVLEKEGEIIVSKDEGKNFYQLKSKAEDVNV